MTHSSTPELWKEEGSIFYSLVNNGDPDHVDDNDPTVHEIRDDAIHNEDIQHSSSSTGASCFFSLQVRCHALLSTTFAPDDTHGVSWPELVLEGLHHA
jgi:hypothetical protein